MFIFLTKSFYTILSKICRPIFCIVCGRQRDDQWLARFILSYFCGLMFAWIFWEIVMANFSVSPEREFTILAVLFVIMGIGFVFSTSMKCTTLLIFVAILGKSGRSYLRALSFAYIIAGPIENLASNSGEIIRVFACSTKLTYNLTKTRFDLMTKPFQKTLAHMRDDVPEIQHTFAEMRNVFEPLRQEVEGDEKKQRRRHFKRSNETTASDIQNRYKHKFELRCKRQLAKGVGRCHQAFLEAYGRCKRKFPPIIRTLLCWPFRATFVCNINFLGDPEEICDPSAAIPDDFGENYMNLSNTQDEIYSSASSVKVNYSINKAEVLPHLQNAEQTADKITDEFNRKKIIFDQIMNIMKTFLSCLFVKIIFSSMNYHRKYKTQIDFDNFYISDYFKHVDKRRKVAGKRSLLPLKKYELNKLIDLDYICSHTKEESKEIWFHLLQFALELTMGCFFLLLDYLIVSLLDIIRIHSKVSYVQEGEHKIKFYIKGSGLMARLMRTTLHNFNMNERVSTTLTNEHCLPKPQMLSRRFYTNLLCLYLVIIILIYKSTMFLRLRRLICSYFYHSREKKRILYLYNKLLRNRRSKFEMMQREVQANIARIKVNRKLNILLKLRVKYTTCCDWLKCLKVARRKCLICGSLEDDDFVICINKKCGYAYCDECWQEMNVYCLVCKSPIKIIELVNFNKFFEEI